MVNTDIYTEQDCPDCKGFNHECRTCDGYARVWECRYCGGKGTVKRGIWNAERLAQRVYITQLINVPCSHCNGVPVIKVARE